MSPGATTGALTLRDCPLSMLSILLVGIPLWQTDIGGNTASNVLYIAMQGLECERCCSARTQVSGCTSTCSREHCEEENSVYHDVCTKSPDNVENSRDDTPLWRDVVSRLRDEHGLNVRWTGTSRMHSNDTHAAHTLIEWADFIFSEVDLLLLRAYVFGRSLDGPWGNLLRDKLLMGGSDLSDKLTQASLLEAAGVPCLPIIAVPLFQRDEERVTGGSIVAAAVRRWGPGGMYAKPSQSCCGLGSRQVSTMTMSQDHAP